MRQVGPDDLANEFARQGGQWGHLVKARLEAVLNERPISVLDLGCSNGVYVRALNAKGIPAFGIDMLTSESWATGGRYVRGDVGDPPIADESVDTVIAFEVLEHLPDPLQALREWRRICRRAVVLSVPNGETPRALAAAGLTFFHWTDRTHINRFDEGTLRRLLAEAGFEVRFVRGILPVLPAVPFLVAAGIPLRPAAKAAHLFNRLSRRRWHLSLLAVAARR